MSRNGRWSGDTFPVGCAWSDKIVFPQFFALNPDSRVPEYQTRMGVYEENCGLDEVHLRGDTTNTFTMSCATTCPIRRST